jgi:hypothetical protein
MATDLANLKTRRSAIYAELALFDGTAATPDGRALPNVSGPGTNIDAQGHRASLYAELNNINEQIAIADGGGFDVGSEGFV